MSTDRSFQERTGGERTVLGRLDALLARHVTDSPVREVAVRALRLVRIPCLTDREMRLLSLAEEVGQYEAGPAFVNHARVYVGLACCSWSLNGDLDDVGRTAALVAAAALGACASENLREVMGLNEKLRIAAATSVDASVAVAAIRVATGELHGEFAAFRALEPSVAALESPRRAPREATRGNS